jgi:hypothetical protein
MVTCGCGGVILEVAVQSAILLPAANILEGIEREIFPVIDAGLLVEYRRRWASVHAIWWITRSAILWDGVGGGCGGRELIWWDEREHLEEESLGLV